MIRILMLLMAVSPLHAGCIEIDGEHIRTGQLAAIIPEFRQTDAAIGFAPAPGAKRVLSGMEIRNQLRRLGLPTNAPHYERVCLVRRVLEYSQNDFAEAIASALGNPTDSFEIIRYGPQHGPAGKLEFSRRGFVRTAANRNPVLWKGRLRYSPSGSVPAWAEVRFLHSVDQFVASQALPAGHILEAGDLQTKPMPADPFHDRSSARLADLVGKAMRRSIKAGTTVDLASLTEPPVVGRGDAVRIEARAGAAFVSVDGTARSAGRIGQEITVRNIQNGKLLKARVAARGVVAVGADE